MFRAIADVLRMIGGTLASILMLPFRLLARLFEGGSRRGRGARTPRMSRTPRRKRAPWTRRRASAGHR